MRYKHGLALFVMFAACLFIYYFCEILSLFQLDFRSVTIFNTVHDLHRLLFLAPIAYASHHFGINGAFASTAFTFLSFLPRAVYISPYPNPFLRMLFFVGVAGVIGVVAARATAALRANEARFRELFDNMSSGAVVYEARDGGNAFIFKNINQAGENIDRVKKQDLIGRSAADALPEIRKSGLFDVLQQVWTTGRPEHYAVKSFEDNRIRSWREHYVYKLHTGEIVMIYDDITSRKIAEEKLHASLQEKDILIREVHHRVKNNMQVISGLLDLQARSAANPELIETLNESQRRIRSMALIHETLYGANDFTRIELAGYARALSNELFQYQKINPGDVNLIIQTQDAIYVDINKAIPCGLILNELISNALKHAFPCNGRWELRIDVGKTQTDEMQIVVRDNGVGLPDDVDIHAPRTIGLYLVNGLVKNQLGGRLEVRRDAGTEVRIRFPL